MGITEACLLSSDDAVAAPIYFELKCFATVPVVFVFAGTVPALAFVAAVDALSISLAEAAAAAF